MGQHQNHKQRNNSKTDQTHSYTQETNRMLLGVSQSHGGAE